MINSNSRVGLQWARFKIELLGPWYGCENMSQVLAFVLHRKKKKTKKFGLCNNWPDRMYLAQCACVFCKWMALQLSGRWFALALNIISVVTPAWVFDKCIFSW